MSYARAQTTLKAQLFGLIRDSVDAVCFAPKKDCDRVYLLNLLARLHLARGQHFIEFSESDMRLDVRMYRAALVPSSSTTSSALSTANRNTTTDSVRCSSRACTARSGARR